MRKLLVLFILAALSLSMAHARGFVPQKVTVEQLRQRIAALHGESDRKVARQLANLQLTERLSWADFGQISKSLRGPKSRTELLALADASAFLDPPASEMVPDPPPDAAAQRDILMRAAQLANDQADRIPNFLAIRSTEHFQDVRVYPHSNKIEYYTPGSFRLIEHQVDDIRCSAGGDEVLDQPDKDLDRRMANRREPLMYMDSVLGYHTIWSDLAWYIPQSSAGLKPTGAFGPWLQAVTGDVPEGKVEWGYWERAGSGRLAVFRFRIHREDSHYTIEYKFAPVFNPEDPWAVPEGRHYVAAPGYHGEIAIDPATGEVARIVVICDLSGEDALTKASIELDYGPVEIGGEHFVMPVRGVSISGFTFSARHYLFDSGRYIEAQVDKFPITSIDDLAFSAYQRYKPRLRILPLKSLDKPAN